MQGATVPGFPDVAQNQQGEAKRDGVREVVGTCSLCRGPVTKVALFWPGDGVPKRQCEDCGAVAVQPFGAFVEMQKPDPPRCDRCGGPDPVEHMDLEPKLCLPCMAIVTTPGEPNA
jgi:hypothetical protein